MNAPDPCGFCRRCAIHDDPAGCLEVERWERENPSEAIDALDRVARKAMAEGDSVLARMAITRVVELETMCTTCGDGPNDPHTGHCYRPAVDGQ